MLIIHWSAFIILPVLVMWVQLTNITLDQSKHRYGKLTSGHLHAVSTYMYFEQYMHVFACNVGMKDLTAYLNVK